VERDSISLIWPGEPQAGAEALGERVAVDLDLETTVRALSEEPKGRETVRRILTSLCRDTETIGYRQEVLSNLLADAELGRGLAELVPELSRLRRYHLPRDRAELLYEVTWRLGELESYRDCVEKLAGVLDSREDGIRALGLRRLHAHVRGVTKDPVFENLRSELPELMSRVRGISSVTIGINLDQDLQPRSAALLRINKERFRGSGDTFLARLFASGQPGPWEGIAPLHSMPKSAEGQEGSPYLRPVMVPLFRDLSDVLSRSCRPVAAALERYVRLNSGFLARLGEELSFYFGALHMVRRFEGWGLPMCRPEIAPVDEGAGVLYEGYSPSLTLRFAGEGAAEPGNRIVRNDMELGRQGAVFVLTGPNRGGKTTYMQAVGLAQILAQAGLYVPARAARISPVDGIFTHFPAEEHPEIGTGRLGEEARRLRELFAAATPNSLILLNESLSATSPGESIALAREVVRVLRLLGARAIFTTHLHELAAEVEALNRDSPGRGRIVSLVALVEDGGEGCGAAAVGPPDPESRAGQAGAAARRTFKIVPGAPAGYSHAREIAAGHGVSYEQLEELLRKRGVLPAG
jgi:DNA mismatch repair protein MutS